MKARDVMKYLGLAVCAGIIVSSAWVRGGEGDQNVKDRWKNLYQDGEGPGGYDEKRFDDADTNKDGFVDWEEAKAAHLFGEEVGGRARFDEAAGDGYLTKGEARQHLDREKANRRKIRDEAHRRAAASGEPQAGPGEAPAGLPGGSGEDAQIDPRTREERGVDAWKRGYEGRGDRIDRNDQDGNGALSREEAVDAATDREKRWGGKGRFDRAAGDDGELSKGDAGRHADRERKGFKKNRRGEGEKAEGEKGKEGKGAKEQKIRDKKR